jgi:hypothetical protein
LSLFMLDLFIIVFGGGRRGGCSTTGCLFWILISVVLSVGLTILVNLIYLLFSSPGSPGSTSRLRRGSRNVSAAAWCPILDLPGREVDRRSLGVEDRINYFERMLADNPDNPTGLLALANEYQKAGRHEDEAAVLERYVSVQADDEGNAYARLGDVLARLGRKDEARAAYERGIGQSEKFGHSGMADDLRLALIQLNE